MSSVKCRVSSCVCYNQSLFLPFLAIVAEAAPDQAARDRYEAARARSKECFKRECASIKDDTIMDCDEKCKKKAGWVRMQRPDDY